jgi:hypothetical protein
MGGAYSARRKDEKYKVLVEKPKGTKPFGRPRGRSEDNIKIYLTEIGFGVWTGLIWLRIGICGRLL